MLLSLWTAKATVGVSDGDGGQVLCCTQSQKDTVDACAPAFARPRARMERCLSGDWCVGPYSAFGRVFASNGSAGWEYGWVWNPGAVVASGYDPDPDEVEDVVVQMKMGWPRGLAE